MPAVQLHQEMTHTKIRNEILISMALLASNDGKIPDSTRTNHIIANSSEVRMESYYRKSSKVDWNLLVSTKLVPCLVLVGGKLCIHTVRSLPVGSASALVALIACVTVCPTHLYCLPDASLT